jgi:mycothiol maleylpyruvate isomerase-like protein
MSDDVGLTESEVATYLEAVDWLSAVIGHPRLVAAWEQHSSLNRYTVGGVATHAVYGGVLRMVQFLGEPEPPGDHPVELGQYFGPNRLAEPDDDDPLFVVLREGAEKTARRGPDVLLQTCRAGREELAHALRRTAAARAIPVARVPGGTTTASEYLRTRVLEVVVHGDDLMASVRGVDIGDPPTAAVTVCLEVCLALARAQLGDLGALRAFTRAERADPGALRVL